MIFPKISKYIVYNYDGEDVFLWQQEIFNKVYLRTVPYNDREGSSYFTVGWWKFMRNATIAYKLEEPKETSAVLCSE